MNTVTAALVAILLVLLGWIAGALVARSQIEPDVVRVPIRVPIQGSVDVPLHLTAPDGTKIEYSCDAKVADSRVTFVECKETPDDQ